MILGLRKVSYSREKDVGSTSLRKALKNQRMHEEQNERFMYYVAGCLNTNRIILFTAANRKSHGH